MKRTTFVILFSLLFFLTRNETHHNISVQDKRIELKAKRVPANAPKAPVIDKGIHFPINPVAKNLKDSFIPLPQVNAGKGYIVAMNVGAIQKKDYSASLGQILSQDQNWVYFQKDASEVSIPTAYCPSKNKFVPLSSVLHIKKVDLDLRSKLIAQGFSEYHYLAPAKILFIESTPEEVLNVYEELKGLGLKVQLEPLDKSHKVP